MTGGAFRLNLADMQMAMEMFDASPDGQAEKRRIEAWLESLPRAEITVSGYWVCATGRCGTCYSCREVAE